jgi:hypothetical protein
MRKNTETPENIQVAALLYFASVSTLLNSLDVLKGTELYKRETKQLINNLEKQLNPIFANFYKKHIFTSEDANEKNLAFFAVESVIDEFVRTLKDLSRVELPQFGTMISSWRDVIVVEPEKYEQINEIIQTPN